MLTRVLTQVYTRVPTKVGFLCVIIPYKGSHSSAHVSAHTGAHSSVHEVVWSYVSANRGLPPPLGRGVCKTKSKNGSARGRKPFIHRVYSAQRGIGTMVSEGARPWGRGRSEFTECHLVCFHLLCSLPIQRQPAVTRSAEPTLRNSEIGLLPTER